MPLNVTAIHKKGLKSNPSNYRPISLTCILCKILEDIIRKHVLEHLIENQLLCHEQYGFVPKRSTTLQLLNVMEEWTRVIDNGGNVDVIYCDIMKAFDQVPKCRLLHKISSYGIKGKILKWIENFLTNRTQTVIVNGVKSSESKVTSGVPQGSVLGPLLFVIYINDMPLCVNSSMYMYADDTKVFREIAHDDDVEKLQNDLDRLGKWSEDWLIRFHPEKCSVLHLGRTNPHSTYELNGHQLEKSMAEKDLGVTIDDKLTFDEHIQAKIGKARQMWGMIRRTFKYIDHETFPLLFKAFVRPHIEYANSVWFPSGKGTIREIESIQRAASKQVPGLQGMSYPDRLKSLRLPTLKHRRRRGDLIEVYKMTTGLYDLTAIPAFEKVTDNGYTRGHCYKMRRPQSRTNIGQNRFTSRVVSDWNALPDEVVESPTINTFKNRLDKFFQNDPTVYDPQF